VGFAVGTELRETVLVFLTLLGALDGLHRAEQSIKSVLLFHFG